MEKVEGRQIHVLVQLTGTPSSSTRRALRKDGLTLLDYVPELAYFASMRPERAVPTGLIRRRKDLVRWIGPIETSDKIDPDLAEGVPDHAMRDDLAELIVLCFGDVRASTQEATLRDLVEELLDRVEPINGWRVLIRTQAIRALAGEDIVKWIAPIPPPAQVDNDGVRSPTGVNADAVQPPNVYNLTGAGVVVGQWEPDHASLVHPDFAGRITVADGPIAANERSLAHTENVAANGQYDDGEAIYSDIDEDNTVSVADVRITPIPGFAANSVVAMGDPDVGQALVLFGPLERFADTPPSANGIFVAGEGIYRDVDGNPNFFPGAVSIGDLRITPPAGLAAGPVAAGDADIGRLLWPFPTYPHSHPTHVAGIVMGSGAQSAAEGGSAGQWRGVAPGATLRSYDSPILNAEYVDAAANGVSISTNSWGTSHMHEISPPADGYDVNTALYDAVVSGRQSDGTPSGLAQDILVFGSSGNQGRPERHTEQVAANGSFDSGESIYVDGDDSGAVSGSDTLRTGAAQPAGTPLVNFAPNEMHAETPGFTQGAYNSGEAVYRDNDASRTVSAGDTRITGVTGNPALGPGTVVAAGDADVGQLLRPFRLWGNVRIPNSAKNTVEVANIFSDSNALVPSSSRGPTDDGRLKPDVSGPGHQAGGDGAVTSTFPDNGYAPNAGTSMSTPAVAGVAALLVERFRIMCGATSPATDTLKALIIHGCQDLATIPNVPGAFTGPDFAHGYGAVRAKESIDLIPHHVRGVAAAVGDTDYTFTIGTMPQLKATLVWCDPAWNAAAAPSAVTGVLQNDLDLVLISPDGTQHTPWVLNPAVPGQPAARSSFPAGTPIPDAARDRRNTVEQVVVDNPMAGTWTIRVTASTLTLPSQAYTVVCEMLPPAVPACAAPASDVWMRDNAGDTGAVPSSGTMYLSPDVWNRLLADGGTTHDNPEWGQPNFFYANIRNAGAATVFATSIDLWIAQASTGLSWPANFKYVGRFPVSNLNVGEVRQVGPLQWNPPPPAPSDHYCLYVRVVSPQDPIAPPETDAIWTNAMNSNNIVWRNLDVVNLLSSKSVTFLVRNIDAKRETVDLEVRVPEEFLKIGQVHLTMGAEEEDRVMRQVALPRALSLLKARAVPSGAALMTPLRDVRKRREAPEPKEREPVQYRIAEPVVRLKGLELPPGEAVPVSITFRADKKLRKPIEVDVVQLVGRREVGGIRYVVQSG
jgi:hypothetical protein